MKIQVYEPINSLGPVGFEPFCKVGPVHFKNSGYVMIVLMKKCIIINCSKTI